VLLAKLPPASGVALPFFMCCSLRHAIPPDSTIIRTYAALEESAWSELNC
jgi:hypothetical protein